LHLSRIFSFGWVLSRSVGFFPFRLAFSVHPVFLHFGGLFLLAAASEAVCAQPLT